jgi:hypothetical protein
MKLHQTPKLPGDVSTAAASMVLQLELGPGSKFECFKLLNSPVSAIYLVCPRSIAVAPGAPGIPWRRCVLGKVIHKIIEMTLALNFDSCYIVIRNRVKVFDTTD